MMCSAIPAADTGTDGMVAVAAIAVAAANSLAVLFMISSPFNKSYVTRCNMYAAACNVAVDGGERRHADQKRQFFSVVECHGDCLTSGGKPTATDRRWWFRCTRKCPIKPYVLSTPILKRHQDAKSAVGILPDRRQLNFGGLMQHSVYAACGARVDMATTSRSAET